MGSICTSLIASLIATFLGEEKVSCDTRNSISNIIYRIRLINWTNLKKKSNSIREIYRETVLNIYIELYNCPDMHQGSLSFVRLVSTL